jgi:hypothetical protein
VHLEIEFGFTPEERKRNNSILLPIAEMLEELERYILAKDTSSDKDKNDIYTVIKLFVSISRIG